MTWRQLAMYLALANLWGTSFLWVRIAVPSLGAGGVTIARLALGVLSLTVLACLGQHRIRFNRPWSDYAVLGLFNAAAQFGLMAYAARTLSAGTTALLVATMPIWSVPIARCLFRERIEPVQLLGIVLGISGVAALAPQAVAGLADFGEWSAIGAALASAVAGAIGSNWARLRFQGESVMAQAIGQQGWASLWLVPVLIAYPSRSIPDAPAMAALAALGIGSTAIAFIFYFRLIADIGATRTLTVEFLVPLSAAVWSWLVLGEAITSMMLIGGGLIVGSAVLVNRPAAR